MARRSAIKANRKPAFRSRIGNGSAILPTTDGRSIWARIMRDTLEALIQHCGGLDTVSDVERMACRRCATLEAELIFLEDKFAQLRADGKAPTLEDLDCYGMLADRQRRLSEPLGLRRRAKDITPRLQDIIDGAARNGSATR